MPLMPYILGFMASYNDIMKIFPVIERMILHHFNSLTHPLFPEHLLLKHFLSRRSCWRDALSLLIQPSVGAQSSIHSCHILILSLGSASGSPVKELTVWGVERDRDWYTEIHLQICTVSQTLDHLPRKKTWKYAHSHSRRGAHQRHSPSLRCCRL